MVIEYVPRAVATTGEPVASNEPPTGPINNCTEVVASAVPVTVSEVFFVLKSVADAPVSGAIAMIVGSAAKTEESNKIWRKKEENRLKFNNLVLVIGRGFNRHAHLFKAQTLNDFKIILISPTWLLRR